MTANAANAANGDVGHDFLDIADEIWQYGYIVGMACASSWPIGSEWQIRASEWPDQGSEWSAQPADIDAWPPPLETVTCNGVCPLCGVEYHGVTIVPVASGSRERFFFVHEGSNERNGPIPYGAYCCSTYELPVAITEHRTRYQ